MKRNNVLEELDIKEGLILKIWFFFLRFVAPLMVALVFIFAVFFGVV